VFAVCPERISAYGFVNLAFETMCIVTALFFPCKVVLLLRRTLYVENVIREKDERCLCPSLARFGVAFATCLIENAPKYVETKRHRASPPDVACNGLAVSRMLLVRLAPSG
jgi:hypothetical protein